MILRYNVPKPSEICITEEQLHRFFDFVMGNDLDFYEEYTINLTEEEQERFLGIIRILCWRLGRV